MQNISKVRKGMTFSNEHKANLKKALIGRKMPDDFQKGEKHNQWQGGTKIKKCVVCGSSYSVRKYCFEESKFCSVACKTSYQVGEKHPKWNVGSSFEPYCINFNDTLKEKIRNRDNHICQLCGKSEILNGRKLAVHHIDGDKMQGCDGKKWHLCALCLSCNSQADTIEKEFLLISNIMWRIRK